MADSVNDINSLVRDVILAQTNLSVDKIDQAVKDIMSSGKYKIINDKNLDDVVKDVISRLKNDESENDSYIDIIDYGQLLKPKEKEKEKSPTGPATYNPHKFLDDGINEIMKNSKDINLREYWKDYRRSYSSDVSNRVILDKVRCIIDSNYTEPYIKLIKLLRDYINEFGGEDVTGYIIPILSKSPRLVCDVFLKVSNPEDYKIYIIKLFSDQDFLHELAQVDEKQAKEFLSAIDNLELWSSFSDSFALHNAKSVLRRRIPLHKPQEIEKPAQSTSTHEEPAHEKQPEQDQEIKLNILQQLDADPDKFRIYCRSKMSQIVQYNHLSWFEEFFRKNPKQIKYLAPKDQRVEYQRAAVESDPSVINDIVLPDFKLSKEVISKDYMLLGSIIRPKITIKAGIEIIPDPTLRLKGTIPVSLTDEQKVELMFMAILKCLANTDILSKMVHFTENDRQEFISKMFFGILDWKELIQGHLESLMGVVFKKMGKQGLWCFMTFLNKALGINLDEQEIIRFMVRNS